MFLKREAPESRSRLWKVNLSRTAHFDHEWHRSKTNENAISWSVWQNKTHLDFNLVLYICAINESLHQLKARWWHLVLMYNEYNFPLFDLLPTYSIRRDNQRKHLMAYYLPFSLFALVCIAFDDNTEENILNTLWVWFAEANRKKSTNFCVK